MSRTGLSTAFKQAMFAQETGELFLALIEISHADLGANDPLRFVNNNEDVDSNLGGATTYTFTAFPFEITLVGESEGTLPAVTLTICNVDRRIVEAVRTISSAPTVSLYVALASTPDTIEIGPIELTLSPVEYNAFVVTGTLTGDDILNEPYPGDRFTIQNVPGLY